MDIVRIDQLDDGRFSQKALCQHGCFLADGQPIEIVITSEYEAVIIGSVADAAYSELIDEFRFYAPHITRFYGERGNAILELPRMDVISIPIDDIQPSQFYIDEAKLNAVASFINKADDIIIQALPHEGRYIALDGHTRLYHAVTKGWKSVRAVIEESDDYIYAFVEEARKRGIYHPKDMALVSHEEYKEKWHGFCDSFFKETKDKEG